MGVLKACDELCGKTKARGDRGNTWWWNRQVKDAIDRKKKALKSSKKSNQIFMILAVLRRSV